MTRVAVEDFLRSRFEQSLSGNFESLVQYFDTDAHIVAGGIQKESITSYLAESSKKLSKGFSTSNYACQVDFFESMAYTVESYQYAFVTLDGLHITGQEVITSLIKETNNTLKIIKMHISFKRNEN
jgi:hypothetical protein